MTSGFDNKLPYGNLPRLLLAWVSTEAVRTQSRELVLGRSLSEFMGKLGMDSVGGARTRLRNQIRRLFIDEHLSDSRQVQRLVMAFVAGVIPSPREFREETPQAWPRFPQQVGRGGGPAREVSPSRHVRFRIGFGVRLAPDRQFPVPEESCEPPWLP